MTPTPTTEDDPRRVALLDVLLQYRDGHETDTPGWWFAEVIADLGHLWNASVPDAAPAGFLDAVAHGVRICDREAAAARCATS